MYVTRFEKATEACGSFVLAAAEQRIVDRKLRALSVVPDYIRTSMVWFKTLDGGRKPKTADFLKILRRCTPFLLADVGVQKSMQTLVMFTEVLREICEATCDFDPTRPEWSQRNLERMQALHKKVVKALVELERTLPESELTIYIHEVLHMVDAISEWNSPRNFWCFICERFVGYCKGFVKNRHLYVANLVCIACDVYICYPSCS